jgi:hypothetical protein
MILVLHKPTIAREPQTCDLHQSLQHLHLVSTLPARRECRPNEQSTSLRLDPAFRGNPSYSSGPRSAPKTETIPLTLLGIIPFRGWCLESLALLSIDLGPVPAATGPERA